MAGRSNAMFYGRVGGAPKVQYSKGNGEPFASFSLAVDRPGQANVTDWVDVICFKKTAELVGEYVEKGDRILVEGRPEASAYIDKQGEARAVLKCVADRVTFIESRKDREGKAASTPPKAPSTKQESRGGAAANNPEATSLEGDDLPF